MGEIRGHTDRLIHTPGYHVKPKYDLVFFRSRQQSGKKRNFDAVLPLTSLIDMFSMLVIFLLMNFSATGEILFITRDLKMPEARHGRAIESLPVVKVSTRGVAFDSQEIDSPEDQIDSFGADFPLLRARLQEAKQMHETIRPNIPFAGQVNIQADENIPLYYIKRVMNILVSEGWTGINFAVRAQGGDSTEMASETPTFSQ